MHYLGNCRRPSRIGEFSLETGRLVYDFKAHTVYSEPDERVWPFEEADPEVLDLAAVTRGMEERGWLVHKDMFPRPLVRMMQAPAHAAFIDEYLSDLVEVAELARRGEISTDGTEAAYT